MNACRQYKGCVVSFSGLPFQDAAMDVPITLRRWFVAHFVVDFFFGIPLLIAPGLVLRPLGWTAVDGTSSRLVGAALLGIGASSWFCRNAGLEVLKAMLDLKLVWSFSAIVGLVISVGQGAPAPVWAFLSLFIAFFGVWTHYRIRFKQLAAAAALDETHPDED
jgi:hypothetical protein